MFLNNSIYFRFSKIREPKNALGLNVYNFKKLSPSKDFYVILWNCNSLEHKYSVSNISLSYFMKVAVEEIWLQNTTDRIGRDGTLIGSGSEEDTSGIR